MLTVILIIFFLVIVVWAINRAARQRQLRATYAAHQIIATQLAQQQAQADIEDLRQARDALVDAAAELHEASTRRRRTGRRRGPNSSALEAVLAMKAEPPDITRREGYWRAPPTPIAGDDDVEARIAAVRQLAAQIEICFTGWTDAEKAELEAEAEGAGCEVRTGVALHLTFLCAGATPGTVKLQQAQERGIAVISGEQFERFICRKQAENIPF